MKLLPQMVDKIKICWVYIGKSNRIMSNKANDPNEASLASNERCNQLFAFVSIDLTILRGLDANK